MVLQRTSLRLAIVGSMLGSLQAASLGDVMGVKLRQKSADTKLDLSGQDLSVIEEDEGKLLAKHYPDLEVLNLHDNRLRFLPNSLGKLKNLRVLIMSVNAFAEYQDKGLSPNLEVVGKLSGLLELNLSSCHLSILPKAIGNLKHLTVLNLSESSLSVLPTSLGNLGELRELNLAGNVPTLSTEDFLRGRPLPPPISNLGKFIGKLSNLQKLNINGNKLGALPEAISKLGLLEELFASNNNLTKLPQSLGRLTKLRKLFISWNKFDRAEKVRIRKMWPKGQVAITF